MLLSTKLQRLFHMGRKKLLNRYLGPYKIVARKGAAAYALRLPAFMGKMHRVCHVSLLKRCKDNCRGSASPPAVLPDGETKCAVERVLAHRDTKSWCRF